MDEDTYLVAVRQQVQKEEGELTRIELFKSKLVRETDGWKSKRQKAEEEYQAFTERQVGLLFTKLKEARKQFEDEMARQKEEKEGLKGKEAEVERREKVVAEKEREVEARATKAREKIERSVTREKTTEELLNDATRVLQKAGVEKELSESKRKELEGLVKKIENQNREDQERFDEKFNALLEKEELLKEKTALANLTKSLYQGKMEWIKGQEEGIADQWKTLLLAKQHLTQQHG